MRLRGISYAATAAAVFGLGAVLAKMLGGDLDASIAACLSLFISGLALAIGLVLRGVDFRRIIAGWTRSDWSNVLQLALAGTSVPLLLIVAGLARTGAVEGGFLLQLNGLAAMVFALILLRERILWKQSLGIALLLSGSGLVVFSGAQNGSAGNNLLGDLLILLGALLLGYGYIPGKRLVGRVDTLPLTTLRLLFGALSLLPVVAFTLLFLRQGLLWRPTPVTLAVLLLYAFSNFSVGYVCHQQGLRLLNAWEVAAILQTIPIFSTTFALLLLRDTIGPLQIAGGLLAVLGGLVVSLNYDRGAEPGPVEAVTLRDDL